MRAGGRAGGHDEANCRFSQFRARAQKMAHVVKCVLQNEVQVMNYMLPCTQTLYVYKYYYYIVSV